MRCIEIARTGRAGSPAAGRASGSGAGGRRGAHRRGGGRRQPSGRVAAAGRLSAAARRQRHSRPRGGRARRGRRRPASRRGARATRVRAGRGGGYATRCVAPAPQCLPVPAGRDARRGGGDARDVLHGLDQRVRARRAAAGRDGALSRRDERHRHDGHPAGGRARGAGAGDGGLGREVRGRAWRLAPSTPSTTVRPTSSPPSLAQTGGRGVDLVLDIMGGCVRGSQPGGAGARRPAGADWPAWRGSRWRRSICGASSAAG